MKSIQQKELRLLQSAHCDERIVSALKVNLFRLTNVGFSKLQRNPQHKVEEPDASEAIACLADAIHYDHDETPYDQIHEYITNIKRIGESSAYGAVYSATLLGEKDAFAYKVAEHGDLTHETAVGFLAVNPLRKITQHFMQTYTSFFCSPPIGNSGQTWCSAVGKQVRYLVVENIVGGISLRKFVETYSTDRVILALLMVYNALLVAQRSCKFIHNDLHYENVMVQTYSEPQLVPYYNESKKPLWLSTLDVPKIIDFGFAAFMHDGEWLHPFPYEYKNPNYLFDFYKLLAFCGQAALLSNRTDTFNALDKMFAYFNEGSLKERIVRRTRDKNDYYEFRSGTLNNPVDFVRYVEKQFLPILRSKLSYNTDMTMRQTSVAQFAKLIMTNSQINRLTDYMYLYNRLPSMSPDMQYIAKQKLATFSMVKFLESNMGYSYFANEIRKLQPYDVTDLSFDRVRQFVSNWTSAQLLRSRLQLVSDALVIHEDIDVTTFDEYINQFNELLVNYDHYIDAIERKLQVAPTRELKALYSIIATQ